MENKTSKYFKYAIGEILLVVIGILIALAINSWNQDRIEKKREISYLNNLREDVLANKKKTILDSIKYQKLLDSTNKGVQMYKTNLNTKNFLDIYKLINTKWSVQRANKSTYDEMLNNGSFYNIQNKNLREQISNYYLLSEEHITAFLEINNNGQNIKYNPDIYPINLLVSQLLENHGNIKDIDTLWMSNKNSKIYVGYFRMARYFQRSNSVRLVLFNEFKKSSDSLLIAIDNELNR